MHASETWPSNEVRPGDIILAKRHHNGPQLRCEGMLLTVSKVESWGVRAYAQLPSGPRDAGALTLIGYPGSFNLGWLDFIMTGGINPAFPDKED